MEPTTFFEHYRICTGEAGREVSRTGAAINYKAIDVRTHEPVRLQLIPKATIDPEKLAHLKERAETAEKLDHLNIAKTFAVGIENDYFVLVSEYFEGETADSWVIENGPMAADAALRVGLQVVRALGAAAFFNLTHRAIQPSNLMIVPGESPSGGWPFIKLLNVGLAGLELHSDSNEAPEIAPSISPQFASPEQRAGGEINFESAMYSLGATICFLLTGAAPIAVSGMKARLRIGRLPELRRAPKPLHNLLVSLLRENPENRPHDPVALERQMNECLTKIERRQAIGRKLGISLASVVPRKSKEARPTSAMKQVLGGFAAVVVLILAGAAAAEYFFHDKIPYLRRTEKIGVQVGVPDAAKFATTPTQGPVAANQPNAQASPAIADANQTANPQPSSAATATSSAVASNTQIASVTQQPEPASPAAGPSEPPSSASTENSEQSSSAEAAESTARERSKSTASTQRSTHLREDYGGQASRNARRSRAFPEDENYDRGPAYQGRRQHAQVVGRTANGRLIVRLSSGRIVVLPRLNDGDIYAPRPRHRVYPDDDGYIPPSQPFYPND
jgi:serine/threonine protein kinase